MKLTDVKLKIGLIAPVAFLQLVEEAGVGDGDRRLVSERLQDGRMR